MENQEFMSRSVAMPPEKEKLLAALMDAESKRKIAQAALEECEERYKIVIENAVDPTVLVDPDTLQVVDANRLFLKMSGYTLKQSRKLSLKELVPSDHPGKFFSSRILDGGNRESIPIHEIRRKDGKNVAVRASAITVHHNAIQLVILTLRDVTDEKRMKEVLQHDLELAANVKKALLPPLLTDRRIEFSLIYSTENMAGGDYYDYFLNDDNTRLLGFILNATGNEIGSALQLSAFQALFRQAYEQGLSLKTAVEWLNNDYIQYFNHSFQAAIIAFEFDFQAKTLTYVSGGIHRFFAFSRNLRGAVTLSGPLIGTGENLSFKAVTVPIANGDTFYFMSDAMTEAVKPEEINDLPDFSKSVNTLRSSVGRQRGKGATALCFMVKGLAD